MIICLTKSVDIDDYVTKDKVRELLRDVTAYAIDVPARFQLHQEAKDPQLDAYFADLKAKKDAAIEEAINQLGSQVDKNTFVRVIVSLMMFGDICIGKQLHFYLQDQRPYLPREVQTLMIY